MAIYAIGDVQGCYDELQQLLELVQFDPQEDTLWFCGDLINRGPQSLLALRLIKSLNPVVVLGNHDLHFLAVALKAEAFRQHKDTFEDILNAPDKDELTEWLLQQTLFHSSHGFNMVHAGVNPAWSIQKTLSLAAEVEHVLQSEQRCEFFKHMYGDTPARWDDKLTGFDRLRLITNTLTRIRFCDKQGSLLLHGKSTPGRQPAGYYPWYAIKNRQTEHDKILFGHWAALEGKVDIKNVYALDTGCVWGGALTAFRLEDEKRFSVPSGKP